LADIYSAKACFLGSRVRVRVGDSVVKNRYSPKKLPSAPINDAAVGRIPGAILLTPSVRGVVVAAHRSEHDHDEDAQTQKEDAKDRMG